ncbi:MAG: filamentous hemagglutinin N-terminal domain-containing protein [Rhizobiales bacterium]|nr:filamentous hemagglutinin N-terminal domain-containing protein [Hyphomicrobiales bacterium]
MITQVRHSASVALSLGYATKLLATTALTAPFLTLPALAQNLPTGASVAAGQVSIAQPSVTQMTITQSSSSAVVNYNTFSVGAGHAVNIQQPSVNAALLNRVTGDTPSTIAGSLTANGQVYLVNPNGIAITPSGTVNVGGGFVASTLGISDSDFMSGKRTFTGNGASAAISNAGTIRVGRGGYAALIGGTVDNSGSIEVPLGKVGLGSGERATLDFSGDGFLQVAAPTKSGGNDALIKHSGRIKADGGSVVISAATAREAARNAINLSGHVQARSISGHSGSITIGGGAGGRVRISGKLNVASRKHKGGHVTVTGRDIALSGATINAAGKTGGGSVRIGGDWQGKGELQRAATTTVDATTTIKADATGSGNGGDVVVWSDGATTVKGQITAKGGATGDGGTIETSGHTIDFTDARIDASAQNGLAGTWLIDPVDLLIGKAAAETAESILNNGTNATFFTRDSSVGGLNGYVTSIGPGDITVAAPITWSTGATLTFDAYHSIVINAPLTISGAGGLVLLTNQGGGSGGTLSFAGGVQYTGTPNSGQSLIINNQPYTLLYDMTGVQNINNDLTGNSALARSLDATGVTGWKPLGTDGAGIVLNGGFTGRFVGLGNTISNLTVNSGSNYVGLFGYSSGAISDIGLLGGSVSGSSGVGGLVGVQVGGSITQAYATGAVTGSDNVGGLVGQLYGGNISQAFAAGSVTGRYFVGGLVGMGENSGFIQVHASGAVQGVTYVGGLVGAGGDISQAYATGAVTGSGDNVGGLVGSQYGNISQTYATGAVTGAGNNVGGLVGGQSWLNSGSIDQAYATGAVTGAGDNIGGLVGYQNDGSITQTYATGAVSGSNNKVGGLIGVQNGGSISSSYFDSYSTGQSIPVGFAGGAVTSVTDITSDPAQFGAANYAYKQSAYGNLTFTATPGGSGWFMVDGQTRPFGAWEYSQAISNAHQLQLVNMDLAASYSLVRNIDLAGEFGRADVTSPSAAQSAGMWNGGFVPLGTVSNNFTGNFSGLGHTISNLIVNIGTAGYAGLFGYSSGDISDLGLVGGSVKGGFRVGGLVGTQNGGSITRVFNTGTVTGSGTGASGNYVGGLVGVQAAGSIEESYATGSVLGGFSVGGLVGDLDGGVIARSYATGAVVASANYVGGLVGSQSSGLIEDSYASGSVRGDHTLSYMVGGLVGLQSTSGTVKTSYATGVVTGANFVGGLIGAASGTVTDSYFDSETTGQSGAGGLTTVQLQAALQANFDPTVWGILPGISYPYLKWRFANGPSIVSGAAVNIAGGNGGLGVGLGVNGTVVAYGHTGANGTYNFMVDPAAAGSSAVTWLTGERFTGGTTASRANAVGEMPASGFAQGMASGLDLYADTVNIKTALPTFTDIAAMMDRGLYGDGTRAPLFAQVPDLDVLLYDTSICGCGASLSVAFHPGVPGSQAQASVRLQASAPLLTWDGSFDPNLPPLNATILAAGNVVVASNNGIGADDLNGGGGKVTMVVDGNLTLEPNSGIGGGGSVAMTVKGDLTVGADATLFALAGGIDADVDGNISLGGAPNNLVQMFGETIRVRAGGDFTMAPDTHLAAYGTGDAIRIAVGGKFDNQTVPDPSDPLLNALVVDPAQARWLVYLDNPTAGHNFGGLDSQNTAIWNTAAFAPVADSGNRYVFAHQPMLTFSSDNVSKTYGATGVLTYTVSGLMSGVTGAYLGDTAAAAYSGAPLLSSAGVAPTAGVAGSPYTVAIADNGLTSAIGYGFQFVSSGKLTVTPAALTITASDASKEYGAMAILTGFTVSGLQNQETVDSLTLSSLGILPTANVVSSPYAITPSHASGTFNAANYAITYVDGHLMVNPAALTITANNVSKSYGQTVTFTGTEFTTSGLQNGESIGSVTLTSLGAAASAGVAGSPYAIAASGASGGSFDAANYTITYVDGHLTVTPAALTITANDVSKSYGQTVTFTGTEFTTSGLQNGESIGSVTLTSLGAASSASVVGSPYAIAASSASGGSFDAANYTISYVDGHLTVNPAALTITANNVSKSYGQTVTFTGTEFTTSGLQNGESIGSVTLTSLGAAASADVAGSPYAITASSASGGSFDATNYTISYASGHLTVTPAALTITADTQSRVEGAANPPLTYRVDGTLFNNDAIHGSLATEATTASSPGAYPITQGTLGVSANYALTYRGALLTILPETNPTPVIDVGAWASRIFFDGFKPIALPDNARPVFGAPNVITSLGIGELYADPRFEQAYVCFGGGNGIAQVCFAARS